MWATTMITVAPLASTSSMKSFTVSSGSVKSRSATFTGLVTDGVSGVATLMMPTLTPLTRLMMYGVAQSGRVVVSL